MASGDIIKLGKTLRAKVWKTPGTYSWTVPNGVAEVHLTGCGAGGGGTLDMDTTNAGSGGVTSFGSLLSLSGGGGASDYSGSGAGGGISGHTLNNGDSSPTYIGIGGVGFSNGEAWGNENGAPGNGGGGGSNGGGAGDYVRDYPVSVVAGQVLTITIGAGGNGVTGGKGGDGYLMVQWWE